MHFMWFFFICKSSSQYILKIDGNQSNFEVVFQRGNQSKKLNVYFQGLLIKERYGNNCTKHSDCKVRKSPVR